METKVWLVTGISSGLGKELVSELLKNNQKVVGFTRNSELIKKSSDNFLPIKIDMTDENQLKKAKIDILNKFGTLDVIVNNAAYAIRGSLEELSNKEVYDNFNINVFSPLNIIRNFVDILREKRNGYIINITSVSGFKASAISGIYGATKFAMEGISEALYQELKPFNVHVISIKPGDMRTKFHSDDSIHIANKSIEDYNSLREESLIKLKSKFNKEESDPVKVANRIIELAQLDNPPLHVFVGKDSHTKAEIKAKSMLENIKNSVYISDSVGFDK